MKPNYDSKVSILIFGLLFLVIYLSGCLPGRVVNDPDYEANDLRRPAVKHHTPLNNAAEVETNSDISIWFDELMNVGSVQANFSVWQSVSIDSFQSVAIDENNPEIIYAAKPGKGIFKSIDGAETWQWITIQSMQLDITELIVCKNNSDLLYAATGDSGVFKSINGGSDWQPVNNGLPEMNITAISVGPDNDDLIYAATNSNGIFKSEDGGSSWNAKNNGLRISRKPGDVEINPLNSNVLYTPSKGDFVLKSNDGGENWTRLRTGFLTFNFNSVIIHPQDTSIVFAVSDGSGIYRSKNSGANWQIIVIGLINLNIQGVIVHPQNVDKLLISTGAGFYKSEDQGDTWVYTGAIPAEIAIFMLTSDPGTPDRILAGTTAGLYQSENIGESWISKNSLSLENLLISGSFAFETWQDSTIVIAPMNSTETDTSVIFPYIYSRALTAWLLNDKKGKPPVDPNPPATKMTFKLARPLLLKRKYQVRINGTFESDRETFKGSYGAEDISGNSIERDKNFTFTTGEN